MVSKTVLVAFVALFCAQAFVSAAPHDEKQLTFGTPNIVKCAMDLAKSMTVVKDFTSIVMEYRHIFADARTAKAACTTDATAEADEATIKACTKEVHDKLIASLITETKTLSEKAMADWPAIQKVITECF